jgi:predicted transposase YdaD
MHDILRDTPIYQEILREGLAEGIEQGREQGIEQGIERGKLEAFKHVLLIWTEKRFPSLITLARERVARIQDAQVLDDMIAEMSVAQTIEDASSILMRTGKNA